MKLIFSQGSGKKIFLLLILFCLASSITTKAQNSILECATIDPSGPDPSGVYSYSTSYDPEVDCEPYVLNVYFWGINKIDGTNDYPNRANDVLQGVANLNITYNDYNVFFKFQGYEEINTPLVSGDLNGYYILESLGQYGDMINWAQSNNYFKEDALNVYAYAYAGFGNLGPTFEQHCGVASLNLVKATLLHEIGHNLNLRHTRSGNENVTRDPLDVNCYNAELAGDRIADTDADPGYYDVNCGDSTDPQCYPFIDSNCLYITGTQFDNCEDPVAYNPSPQNVKNIMTNAYICVQNEWYMTPGQGIRVRETLDDGVFDDALNENGIESLYQPYSGEYYFAGSYDPAIHTPLFQPGFDYRFVECDCEANCPEPSPYDDISFQYTNNSLLTISKYETDFSLITHPNGTAIQIDLGIICDSYGQRIRHCYENYNLSPNSGSITEFHDGVFNTNVTVTPQDSTQINNPNLVNDLNPGLYKIEKERNNSPTEQLIIVKENE